MMSDELTFEDLLPTLRAHYAYLECGRYLMKEVFLWHLQLQDIPNVQDYILQYLRMPENEYEKLYNYTLREVFKCNGIGKIDITALWRLYETILPCRLKDQDKKLLKKITNERNVIIHNLFMKVTVHNKEELENYFTEVNSLVDEILTAFDGIGTEQQKNLVRDEIGKILFKARKETTQCYVAMSTENLNVQKDDKLEEYVKMGMNSEDTYLKLSQEVIHISGWSGNLNIYNTGGGNVSLYAQHCTNVQQNVYHVGTINQYSDKK